MSALLVSTWKVLQLLPIPMSTVHNKDKSRLFGLVSNTDSSPNDVIEQNLVLQNKPNIHPERSDWPTWKVMRGPILGRERCVLFIVGGTWNFEKVTTDSTKDKVRMENLSPTMCVAENSLNPEAVRACVPQDSISRTVYALASQHLPLAILDHCLRVWVYAPAFGEHGGPSPSRFPLLSATCILHDLGATPAFAKLDSHRLQPRLRVQTQQHLPYEQPATLSSPMAILKKSGAQ
ncbi:hypothetical protein F5890DRAFT_1504990 [Lentinula detonsa]|uniref:Uncharacterized protein n=1 Tax=Lentinula detonsa TaxID=2804962 RepID=A0AA38Q281_9AGAR|nr:hypothetical protein F5890DRAFT_1504990 [Lentinula detonsa]